MLYIPINPDGDQELRKRTSCCARFDEYGNRCSSVSGVEVLDKAAETFTEVAFPINMAQTTFTMIPSFICLTGDTAFNGSTASFTEDFPLLSQLLGKIPMGFFAGTQFGMALSTIWTICRKAQGILSENSRETTKYAKINKLIKEEGPLLLNLACNILAGVGAIAANHALGDGVTGLMVGSAVFTGPMFFTIAFLCASAASAWSYLQTSGPEATPHLYNAINTTLIVLLMPVLGLSSYRGFLEAFGCNLDPAKTPELCINAMSTLMSLIPATVGTYLALPETPKNAIKSTFSSIANCFGTMFKRCSVHTVDVYQALYESISIE